MLLKIRALYLKLPNTDSEKENNITTDGEMESGFLGTPKGVFLKRLNTEPPIP